jgi:hypothetical protein
MIQKLFKIPSEFCFECDSYVAKYVVAAVKESRKLIVWICKVFEAIFPQSHVLETAE